MGDHRTKICMLADSHGLYDDRIYWKESVSLKRAGYDVHYLLAGVIGQKGVTAEGISYEVIQRDRVPSNSVLNYFAKRLPGGLYAAMFRKAAGLGADVYHIHDLKVNRIGHRLKALGNRPKLIYDVHEPFPENILDYWPDKGLKGVMKHPWAGYIRWWERRKAAACDLIITTEQNMWERFKAWFPGKPVEIIFNYTNLPGPGPLDFSGITKTYDAIYTGGITRFRGAWQILEAVKIAKVTRPDVRILFLGSWFPAELKQRMQDYIRDHGLTRQVEMKDSVPYHEVAEYYRKSRVGLGIFLPIRTHKIILQIKIFEYLNFGLPILGSNFGHIASIIEKHRCGLSVDPDSPDDIARGLHALLSDRVGYSAMSENGLRAASDFYRWETMEKKLIALYDGLTRDKR